MVVDFDKPTARVYLGSYNFSVSADIKNGENLLLIKDRRIVTAYMIEAIRIFDHYHFRVVQMEAEEAKKELHLLRPPRNPGEKPWWSEDYTVARKIRDREIFS
jgi:phosphatidylserine/phosphatidylglycerophosphate/cardiolipin synthase-like enzyme